MPATVYDRISREPVRQQPGEVLGWLLKAAGELRFVRWLDAHLGGAEAAVRYRERAEVEALDGPLDALDEPANLAAPRRRSDWAVSGAGWQTRGPCPHLSCRELRKHR